MNFLMQQKKDKENGLLGWGTCKAKGEGLVSQTLTFKKLLPLYKLIFLEGPNNNMTLHINPYFYKFLSITLKRVYIFYNITISKLHALKSN